MPIYAYECCDCKHKEEVFYHSFDESKSFIKCPCGNRAGRIITGDHRVWLPPMKKRLKKIFAKQKNEQYKKSQISFPNKDKVYTSRRKR